MSDFCNRVNQSVKVRKKKVIVKNSNLVSESCFLLLKMGYILAFLLKNFKYIIVFAKYCSNGSVIRGLIAVNKSSNKLFLKYKKIIKYAFKNFYGLIGFMAFSTNKGKILLDFQCISNATGGKPLWIVY